MGDLETFETTVSDCGVVTFELRPRESSKLLEKMFVSTKNGKWWGTEVVGGSLKSLSDGYIRTIVSAYDLEERASQKLHTL